MQKIMPAPEVLQPEQEHQPRMTKAASLIFSLVAGMATFFGQIAMKVDEKKGEIKFKLFSCSSIFTLIRLVVFNLPFVLTPAIIYFGGFSDQELKDLGVSTNVSVGIANISFESNTREIVQLIGYFTNYTYFALPFVFAYYMTESLDKVRQISIAERKFMNKRGLSQLTPPIVAFILYAVGSFMQVSAKVLEMEAKLPGFIQLPLTVFSMYGLGVFSSLGLQFLLSSYEFFFYINMHDFHEIVRILMKTPRKEHIFSKVKNLVVFMENFQECFGIFLLFDLSLMFLYWLIHLYNAYFTFQEGFLAASGSVLIILAELWRVVLISNACQHFTGKTDMVIRKLEELRLTIEDVQERRVRYNYSYWLYFLITMLVCL